MFKHLFRRKLVNPADPNDDLLGTMHRYIGEGEDVRGVAIYGDNLATLDIGGKIVYYRCDIGRWFPTTESDAVECARNSSTIQRLTELALRS